MLHTIAPDPERLALENPEKAAQFAALNERLAQGAGMDAEQLRAWCQAGLELGRAAGVQGLCQDLLARPEVHPALRPYWLFFLGGALLQQFQVEAGVAVLREALQALCVAPRVHNPRARLDKYEDPRIEQLLWQALAQLAAGGVRAFAHAGTLLGLEREQRLLPFDKDLDLGLLVEDLPRAVDILRAHGWRCPALAFNIDNMRSLHHPGVDVVLDLCGLMQESGSSNLLGGFWIRQCQPIGLQRLTRFPGPVELEQVAGPAGPVWRLKQPQRWLEALYGAQWRTPDPSFDTIIGAHNLIGFSPLTQWYAYARISNAWLNGHWEKALRLAQLVLQRHTPDDALLRAVAATLQGHLAQLGGAVN
ncbi:hypothetical protein [Janthinobacterium fluminis]|uniref:Nucleotidyltransferase family protein n=1 Tax=Janthinobacterium fluminis TaxID=2987524 RepID=A0ABT5JYS0_9BURK|nr:hypothetical protein [Janthinobacterium fluminis]MDC8757876.1 hypothetical protein [Janthinobacterium fluminis]